MSILAASLCTLLLGLALTLLVRLGAHRFGLLATPRRDRWHRRPTATLGGIALFVAFIVGYLSFAPRVAAVHPILAAGALLFFVGLVDDVIRMKLHGKLLAQIIAASVAVYFGPHLNWTSSDIINDSVTIIWLVGMTNAINLLDNMDGLAGGVSLISCGFLFAVFLVNGQANEATLMILLASALLGFLVFNFHPASIFMGDSGSMFLGFVLSGTALLSDFSRASNSVSLLLSPVLIMAIPIFDTCLVILTRKVSGRPIAQGGCDHTSHRLVALGLSERRAVFVLYSLASVSGALGLMVTGLQTGAALLLVTGFAAAGLVAGIYLGRVPIHQSRELRSSRNVRDGRMISARPSIKRTAEPRTILIPILRSGLDNRAQ